MIKANGYGEFDNCLTSRYIILCHYLRRWLLTSSSYIQVVRLCIHVANITNYIRCGYKTCYFVGAKGIAFHLISLLEGQDG
jgi:hypothetical protein